MSGYLSNKNQSRFISNEDYAELEGAGNINAIEVYAQFHHAMLIDKDGQVMGIGLTKKDTQN